VELSLLYPRFGSHPSKSERFTVDADGMLDFEVSTNGATIDSMTTLDACQGRLSPILHRLVVEAALVAIRMKCVTAPPNAGMAHANLRVSVGGKESACEVDRSSSAFTLFDTAKEKALKAVCPDRSK
jgi:hypothetical protein